MMNKLTYPFKSKSSLSDDLKIERKKTANSLAVRWAHASNSQQLLDEALKLNDFNMIEPDIVHRNILKDGSVLPKVAHPRPISTDLSLGSFLVQVKLFNLDNPDKIKGIKFDFKSIEAFEVALDRLKRTIPEMNHPIGLNADIAESPVNNSRIPPIDARRAQFKQAVLSLGWTAQWSEDPIEGSYTPENIVTMLTLMKENNIVDSGQCITFPLRAGIAANSKAVLHDLIRSVEATNDCTITVWSAPFDYIGLKKLRQLILFWGSTKIYLDVPADQTNLSVLRLSANLWRSFTIRSPLYFSVGSLVMFLIRLLLKKSDI
uniref:Menorin-like domain-containing protein n=1 Tax=Glossina austeni TaxID=7395 RepID=A0A1A9UY70_GLOAU